LYLHLSAPLSPSVLIVVVYFHVKAVERRVQSLLLIDRMFGRVQLRRYSANFSVPIASVYLAGRDGGRVLPDELKQATLVSASHRLRPNKATLHEQELLGRSHAQHLPGVHNSRVVAAVHSHCRGTLVLCCAHGVRRRSKASVVKKSRPSAYSSPFN
jgi:hypothetical protein